MCLDGELECSGVVQMAAVRLLTVPVMALLLGAEERGVRAAIRRLEMEPEGWMVEPGGRPFCAARRSHVAMWHAEEFYAATDMGRVGEELSWHGERLAGPAGCHWKQREWVPDLDVPDEDWPG